MEIFSAGAHNKSLIMNNTNELFVLTEWSLAGGVPGLQEIVFGFHMGAAVRQNRKKKEKANSEIIIWPSRENYRIRNNAIMYVY